MSNEFSIPEIAKREENFFNGKLPDFSNEKVRYYFSELQGVAESIEVDIGKLRGMDKKQLIKMVFQRVYNFVLSINALPSFCGEYCLFDSNSVIYNDVFDACFFISLCMFLYDTKRIDGLSLREYIYQHSPIGYNVKGSPNYFDYKNTKREFSESNSSNTENNSNLILADDAKLRQYRKRLLSERPVYQPSVEWSAIRKVSEHEWLLYFLNEENASKVNKDDEKIREREKAGETLKRIRNLYTGVNKVLKSFGDDGDVDRLTAEYNKFLNKLKKIKYEDYLSLNKICLAHIQKDMSCYGINLYRLEKELRLYNITSEIDCMLKCKSEDEENEVLYKSLILKDIPFTKLYEYFYGLENCEHIKIYAETFSLFMDELTQSSRLVIDKFVEHGSLGEDWDSLLLKVINEMVEMVFYAPESINFGVESKSQDMFMKVISMPVYDTFSKYISYTDYMQFTESDIES